MELELRFLVPLCIPTKIKLSVWCLSQFGVLQQKLHEMGELNNRCLVFIFLEPRESEIRWPAQRGHCGISAGPQLADFLLCSHGGEQRK